MPKRSGLLLRMNAKNKLQYAIKFDRQMQILQQMCIDSAFMAANDVFQMGPGRCEQFGQAISDYLHEMAGMLCSWTW